MRRSIGKHRLHPFRALGKDEVNVLWMFVNHIQDGVNLCIREVIMEEVTNRINEDPARVPIARYVIKARIMEDG